jgi:hypothetical protein
MQETLADPDFWRPLKSALVGVRPNLAPPASGWREELRRW